MYRSRAEGGVDGAVLPRRPPVDAFLEAKLHWPRERDGWVDRARLLDAFDASTRRPVSLVAAPAGYGKTTLAAQWLAHRRGERIAAWVSLDAADNDPGRLWTHIVTALERAGSPLASDAGAHVSGRSSDLADGVLPQLVNAMAAAPTDVVLILDDFHYLQSAACRERVMFLIENLPDRGHLVILSRSDPGLRLGRLRASGMLGEIRAEQLRFTASEAGALMTAEQVHLSEPGLAALVDRTEGWPAGVYLASLSLSGRPDPDELVRNGAGNDRFVTSYFSEEVLSQHSEQLRDFIITMSVLDRFCAPLCDAVAEGTGSAQLLAELEAGNLFLVPLDGEGRWFRFHHLFAAVARSELDVRHGDLVPLLHERAARWYRANGHVDEAIIHLRSAGQRREAAELVAANWMTFVDAGRAPTVAAWLQSLGRDGDDFVPAEAVTAAWMAAVFGDEAGLARHVHSLEGYAEHGPLPDGSHSVGSALSLIETVFGYGGPLSMRAAAERAVATETDGLTPFYAMAHMGFGHAAFISGELNRAVEHLEKVRMSEASPDIIKVMALSLYSLAEGELGRLERSRELAESALEIVESNQLQVMPQAAAAFAALGQVQAAFGKVDDAMDTLEQGLAIRRRYPIGFWGPLHHVMVMARVAVQAERVPLAQELLSDLAARMSRFPDGMSTMRARQAAIEAALREQLAAQAPEEELTTRELDILQLLQGSLSIREIGDELRLSPNTVKSHAKALYRKLGAHSRDEAVATARRNQLI
ncbi:MAG TPA: LuxR C-terminal-related transcriptional regulator [Nocardioides sp.]|nr:LuxR C-terminal-related transcriptional regulator [Nocardioides sp.]